MIILYFNESNVGINRGIVHENYIPDAYKYQIQNRWQPLGLYNFCYSIEHMYLNVETSLSVLFLSTGFPKN
jgi:hypothetical protein